MRHKYSSGELDPQALRKVRTVVAHLKGAGLNRQECGRVSLPVIESADGLPVGRNLEGRVTNDDLIGITIKGLREDQFTSAGFVDDLLLAIPSGPGSVLALLRLDPIGITFWVGTVVDAHDRGAGSRVANA